MGGAVRRSSKFGGAVLASAIALTGAGAGTAASLTVAETRDFRDGAGDVPANDLDITGGRIIRANGNITLMINVAARVKGNAIYGAYFYCGGTMSQLAVKRAGGSTDAFVFNFATNTNSYVAGIIDGRTILTEARASQLGCASGRVRFDVFAEATNGRRADPDRVPSSGKLTL